MGMNMKKWAVLAGSVIAGLIILSSVLGGAGLGGAGTPVVLAPATTAPPVVPTDAVKPPKSPQPVDPSSAVMGIYNGTAESGLADKVARKLDTTYDVQQVGNTLATQSTSVVYWVKNKDQTAAEAVAAAEFPTSDVLALPKGTQVQVDGTTQKITSDLQVVIFLGDDQIKGSTKPADAATPTI